MHKYSRLMLLSAVAIAAMLAVPAMAIAAGPPASKGMGAIEGYLIDETTGAPITVEGWVYILDLFHQNGEMYLTSTLYTPEPGHYIFEKVPVGEYTMRTGVQGYEVVYEYDVSVQMRKTTWLDFEMRRTGSLYSLLKDAGTLDPIVGAFAYLVDDELNDGTYSDENGQVYLSRVLPGVYTLIIEADGYPQYVHPEPVEIEVWHTTHLGWILL